MGEEHGKAEVALALEQGLLGAGCVGQPWAVLGLQQLRLQEWVLWLQNPVLPGPGHWAAWEWSVMLPCSHLQQAHEGSSEDNEARQHVCGCLLGRGKSDEDTAA